MIRAFVYKDFPTPFGKRENKRRPPILLKPRTGV